MERILFRNPCHYIGPFCKGLLTIHHSDTANLLVVSLVFCQLLIVDVSEDSASCSFCIAFCTEAALLLGSEDFIVIDIFFTGSFPGQGNITVSCLGSKLDGTAFDALDDFCRRTIYSQWNGCVLVRTWFVFVTREWDTPSLEDAI